MTAHLSKEALLKTLESPIGKTRVEELAEEVSNGSLSLNDLLEFTFYHQAEVAFRAAWVLENVVLNFSVCDESFLCDFIEKYPVQPNQSCRRHYTKMMMHLQTDGSALSGADMEPVAEATFEWLIDPRTPVAVKANCLDILLGLSRQYPWIREELPAQTEFVMKTGTASIQARGKKILRRLT